MTRKTFISSDLKHVTKFIDPRSGKVLREGTTPTSTINDYKANPNKQEVSSETDRLDKLEKGMDDIKELLTKLTK